MRVLPDQDAIKARVREICSYYSSNGSSLGTSVIVSKSMLAFALEIKDPGTLETLIKQLKKQGAVSAVAESMISFSPAFLCGEA